MQLDRSREEMSLTISTELQLCSLQSLFPPSFVKAFFRSLCNNFKRLNKDCHDLHLWFYSNVSTLDSGGTYILMEEDNQQQRDQDLVQNPQLIEFIGNPVNLKTKLMFWYSLIIKFVLPEQADIALLNDSSFYSSSAWKNTDWYIKELFKEQRPHSERFELFNQTMNLFTEFQSPSYAITYRNNRDLPSRLLDKGLIKKGKQYASAVVIMNDGGQVSFKAFPDFNEKKHSEHIVIDQIENNLQENGTKVSCINLYTYNSPCLRNVAGRPCMFLIQEKAYQWKKKYGFVTKLTFTELWGPAGNNFFCFPVSTDPLYPDISNNFYLHIEEYNKIPFALNTKQFKNNLKKSGIFNTVPCVEDSTRNDLKKNISSAVDQLIKLAESLSGLTDELLDHGLKKISSFTFPPEVQDTIHKIMEDEWEKLVINSSNSHVREKKTADFNTAFVKLFVKLCESDLSSPLRFSQLRREDILNS